MGFYLRKSISAGPFRFNLSGSGLGLSVGVKGFRVGTGPRGNYVHMGRDGLYYRASLGGAHRPPRRQTPVPPSPSPQGSTGTVIETGDVLEMKPTTGSHILEQINEKMALSPLWPWALVGGGVLSVIAFSQPNGSALGIISLVATAALSAWLAFRDQQRRAVVVMYDLGDDAIAPFQKLTEEFDRIRSVNQIWNVDTAEYTADWKRNAGAGRLLSRKAASLTYSVPRVVKTNVSVPAIIGGRQNVYFFPDVVLIVEGPRAGALSYDQLEVLWSTTVFIEDGSVPGDAQIVGHTWRFVNKNGGPDRRFNNNRQLPKALYLQMGLSSEKGLRKILHFSRVVDHTGFDAALDGLRGIIKKLNLLALAPARSSESPIASLPAPTTFVVGDEAKKIETEKPKFWEYKLTAVLLHDNVGPVIDQSKRLQRGAYTKGIGQIASPQEALDWCRARMDELPKLSEDFGTLVNERLPASWGPAGQPGDITAIEKACGGLTDCARNVLTWKEIVRFTKLPSAFLDVQSVLSKFPDSLLEQIGRISTELDRVFGQKNPSGTYNINLVVTAPENWSSEFNEALKVAARSIGVN
jgi:hypothetical protein